MLAKAKLRNWGSSLGIVVPKEVVESQSLKPGDEVTVDIKPALSLKDVFGIWKDMPIDAQKMKDEIRAEQKRDDEKLFRHIRNHRDS